MSSAIERNGAKTGQRFAPYMGLAVHGRSGASHHVPVRTHLPRRPRDRIGFGPQDALRAAACYATLPVRFVAFWLAVLLPLTYLPLLATGVMTGHLAAFAGLFGLNAVAFVVGHSYNQPV
ncbi:hypothetical protein ACFQL0_09190 [Haloplanus litoreus]|uniref:hypothetical protein n=1 Tax=Haloplanus litoreus TaxID=767515 RepID=UPI00361F11FE